MRARGEHGGLPYAPSMPRTMLRPDGTKHGTRGFQQSQMNTDLANIGVYRRSSVQILAVRSRMRLPCGRYHTRGMIRFAAAIFVSAFLLFAVQPLIGKFILPWFGGGAGVWNACLLFFQVMLLIGYAYAHVIDRLAS